MKVKDLIWDLQKVDGDLDVVVSPATDLKVEGTLKDGKLEVRHGDVERLPNPGEWYEIFDVIETADLQTGPPVNRIVLVYEAGDILDDNLSL